METEAWLALLIFLLTGGCTLGISLVVSALVLLPFILIGRYLLKRSKQAGDMRQASQDWRTTTGKVLKSRVEVRGGDHTSVKPRIIYEYTVFGQMYQSEQIRAGDKFLTMRTSRQAYDLTDRYPVDATVTVYYNPANPAESALER